MKTLFACLICIFCLVSCKAKTQKNCSILLFNKSKIKIDSLKITTYGLDTTFSNILPNKKVEKVINVQYAGEYEGSFLITIYVKNLIRGQATFGYYSNSDEIKSHYFIEILDNFAIKEKSNRL